MKTYERWLFGISAVFNLCVAAALLFLRTWIGPLLKLDPITGTNFVLIDFTGAMIALFGYGYIRIALDPVRFRPLIPIFTAGKLLALACAILPWI